MCWSLDRCPETGRKKSSGGGAFARWALEGEPEEGDDDEGRAELVVDGRR